jgi:alkanesulfonate monooxygenase SsuD/methylene tetrahydromethanopterin reductase-like flavin-dependent oxidoreductase (luciferase family)
MPILIGGSGPTKTLRTTAAVADIWNGYGLPERIAEVGEVLRQRCDEVGRPFDDIERTVTIHGVIRDDPAAAREAWAETARLHGLEGVAGSDGTDRGLTVGGTIDEVAALVDRYRQIGVREVIFTFRDPFDSETIERLGELRAAVGD